MSFCWFCHEVAHFVLTLSLDETADVIYLYFQQGCPDKVPVERRNINSGLFPYMRSLVGITHDQSVIQNHAVKL